jgi:FkbH-like protein
VKRQTYHWIDDGVRVVTGLVEWLLLPLWAALYIAGLVHLIGLERAPVWVWITLAPLLYLAWLVTYLALCAVEMTFLRLFYTKPRRFNQLEQGGFTINMLLTLKLYGRLFFINSLPLIPALWRTPLFGWLVFRAYGTSVHIGRGSLIIGEILDPDLTHVGEDCILGMNSRLVAHSVTRLPEGLLVFQSAPIRVGKYSTISGNTLVELGATIGENCLIEPFSRVAAFTVIPDGEVWGGNPAVYRCKRDPAPNDQLPSVSAAHPSPQTGPDDPSDPLPALVAHALGLPPEKMGAFTGSSDCPAWDSLGKMAIAAALHQRFQIRLSPEETFSLDSMAQVRRVCERSRRPTLPDQNLINGQPDWLPLQDPVLAARHLLEHPPAVPVSSPTQQVAVAATFVAQPLAPSLTSWCAAFGIRAGVEFAPFNQVVQSLLDPEGPFHRHRAVLPVILARPEDFPGGWESMQLLLEAIRKAAPAFTGTLLVADLPPALFPGRPDMDELRSKWQQALSEIPSIQILEFSRIVREIGETASRDPALAEAASAPFSPEVYHHLGINIARKVRAMHVAPKKVIALDGDGTLWDGVLGEDGPDGIRVGPDFLAFQKKLASLHERGVILVLVSKNDPEDVWDLLDRHPEMVLHRKHFAAARINWLPKSENLRSLAEELNLGLESVAFFDDNPAERLEVEAHASEVAVVPLLRPGTSFATALDHLWLFDGAGETSEDLLRNRRSERHPDLRGSAGNAADLGSYLQALELVVEVRRALPEDLPRLAQLSLKTNQFHTTLKRYTLPELHSMAGSHDLWSVHVRDKYGDYGQMGGAVGRLEDSIYLLDAVFVSCRVLGRGVEDALLHALARVAVENSARALVAPFRTGTRNQPARLFLERTGFVEGGAEAYERKVRPVPALPAHLALNFQLL